MSCVTNGGARSISQVDAAALQEAVDREPFQQIDAIASRSQSPTSATKSAQSGQSRHSNICRLLRVKRTPISPSNRRMLRQSDDVRPAVSVTARAAHVAQCHPHRCFRVARLNAQVQIDHRPAGITRDHQARMLCSNRGGYRGPEPHRAVGRANSIELPDDKDCLALGSPGALHALHGLHALMMARAAVFLRHAANLSRVRPA